MMLSSLVFVSSALYEFEQHVVSQYPNEACGFFSGRADKADMYWPIENILSDSERFVMDGASVVRTTFAILGRGEEIVAAAHSQPLTTSISNEDIIGHQYYQHAYMLIATMGNPPLCLQLYKHHSEGYKLTFFTVSN